MRIRAVALIAAALASVLGGALTPSGAARSPVRSPSYYAGYSPGLGSGSGAELTTAGPARVLPGSEGCLRCHEGIEEMHPGFPLSCIDCHGGDDEAREKIRAHVAAPTVARADERVAPKAQELAHLRFVNPTDLRVADKSCGECHGDLIEHLMVSLHGTTAGHLSDGFFEAGLQKGRDSRYSVFPVSAPRKVKGSTVQRLVQPPRFDSGDDPLLLSSHFPDLVRKECMQCHLWSQGRAVRGRVGFDGEYRGAGCAACHVRYRTDGFSESADPTADRTEPGHPMVHTLVTSAPTETCTTCHYGDASIGLHFRGLSQLPPGAPAGPEIDGTTDQLLHRSFFVNDPEVTPPDVHHESGLHCVDCHTLSGVMGDGRLVSKMEEMTKITCEACHGSFTAQSTLATKGGVRLKHLFERDGDVWMRSKVTGAEHRIKQAVDVVDPRHRDYNAGAELAMTGVHGDIACYTCHAGWNVNFLGFHFYRNEALSQLDLLSGTRTAGRVTTQEKVFTTWKSFYAGLDERGRVAPYLTGFSTMGTVDDADGKRILDQEFPVTASGLSGLTMIHHQLHSTRPTARSCVECHRASETWGMGSGNFRLGRQLVFVADRRGIEIVAFDRENPQLSVPLVKFVLPHVVDIELEEDTLHGHAQYVYVSEGQRGVHVFDVRDPRSPKRVAFQMTVSPRGMARAGTHLYVADGIGGLKVFDIAKPDELKLVATVPTIDAHDVEIRWPYAYLADGPGGLVVVDIRVPVRPRVVGGLDTGGGGDGAIDIDVLFQYSRPMVDRIGWPSSERTKARRLVAVCDAGDGPILIDATEPTHLELIGTQKRKGGAAEARRDDATYIGVALRSHVDLATPQGGDKTSERDYMYFVEERQLANGDSRSALRVVDVTDPTMQKQAARVRVADQSEMLEVGEWYTPPFLRTMAFVPDDDGVAIVDIANSGEPSQLGAISSIREAYVLRAEQFPLDQMLDVDGKKLKDVSHPVSRWLLRGEIETILDVPGEDLGTIGPYAQKSIAAASSARRLFARADVDRSGLLVEEERDAVGGAAVDDDGDGRITLAELAKYGGQDGRTVLLPQDVVVGPVDRTGPDGDLSRLLDGVDPFAFDKKKDGKLDRKEAERAFFAALDLDGSGRIDVNELSRHPGPLRDLRFGDRAGLEKFAKVDRSGGGTIGPREFDLRDEDWVALDPNGDGYCQLDPRLFDARRGREQVAPDQEWPTTRRFPVLDLPPGATAESILAALDENGDGQLSKRELRRRPRLMLQLDVDRSTIVEADELARAERLLTRWGVEGVPDAFMARWDLDRNGKISDEEVPPVVQTLLRRRVR